MMLTHEQLAYLRDRVEEMAEAYEIELSDHFESAIVVELTRLIEGMITPPPERRFYVFECDLGPDSQCYEYVIARDEKEALSCFDENIVETVKKLDDTEHNFFLAPVRQPRRCGYACKNELVLYREDSKIEETIYSYPSYYTDDNGPTFDGIAYHDKKCIHCKKCKYGSKFTFSPNWTGMSEVHYLCWDCQKKIEQKRGRSKIDLKDLERHLLGEEKQREVSESERRVPMDRERYDGVGSMC
jgi:hypothetical protein